METRMPTGHQNPRRSIVWNFYKKRFDGSSVTCKLCKLTSKHFGNTTNLMSHLKRKHPVEFQKSKDERNFYNSLQSQINESEIIYPISESSSGQFNHYPEIKYPNDSNNETHEIYLNGNGIKQEPENVEGGFLSEQERGYLHDGLLDMLVMDFHHPSIVGRPGFDYFTRTLCPLFTLPTVEDLTERLIPGRYYSDRNAVMELLDGCESVGLSTTFHNNFVTISVCFITDYKFKRFALATRNDFPNCLSEVLSSWKIQEKITAITIDDPGKAQQFGDLNCYQINVNNFKSIYKDLENLSFINKTQAIADFFKTNQLASRKLTELGGANQKLTDLKIINSIEWLINNRTPITLALNLMEPSPENFDTTEWDTLADWLNLQLPIQKVVSELSNNCTISCLIPLYRGLQSLICKKNTQTDFGSKMKSTILKNCTELAETLETNELTAKACLLDPRFKKFGFTHESYVSEASEAIINELTEVLKPILEDNPASPEEKKKQNLEDDDDLWGDFNEKIAGVSCSTRSVCSGILQKYLALPIVDRKSDPMDFWKEHSVVFPSLRKLAVKYLCVPAVPAFTEQLFPNHVNFTCEGFDKLDETEIDRYIFLKSVLTDRYG